MGRVGDGSMGQRNDANIRAAFSKSPLYNEYSETAVQDIGVSGLNGNGGAGDSITGASNGILNDAGHTFGTFDLNYGDSPNLEDVETGGAGLPSTPYTPNPTSPGPGSVFANDQDEFTGVIPDPGVEFGSGLGGLASPSNTRKGVSSQGIGSYISGRSYEGSDGQV
jgi:hypothetical protein